VEISFSCPLVALSLLVAVFVSNTALALFYRVAHAEGTQGRIWLLGGSFAMGCGIWATHFVGMLALSLPIKLTYDFLTTAVSLLIVIAMAFTALAVATSQRVSVGRLACSAALLGTGISAMHYCGMAAIQIVPMIKYEPWLVVGSVVMAIGGSFLSLSIFFGATGSQWSKVALRIVAACVLGLSIGSMHYMGMFASKFSSGAYCLGRGGANNHWLAILVTVLAFAVLTITTVLLIYDGYLSSKTREYHKRLETANAQLRHAATHDSLTGLPNRVSLARQLDDLIETSAANGSRHFAVMMIDLDRFKEINDSLGHLAGDELLCRVAACIKASIRAGTTLARLGGDEFVLLVDNLRGANNASTIATRLLEAIAEPISLCGLPVHVSASIGIARYPEDGADSTTLLQRADAAMYHVKNSGRGGFQFFTSEIRAPSRERLKLEDGLRRALARREFELHYQPKVDVRTGRIVGSEALIRWRHPELGLVPPLDFIPLAEETGLIVPIGEWAIREACNQAVAWQRTHVGRIRIAVNVSAKQFQSRDFSQVVANIIRETGLDPQLLELELTESAVMTDVEGSIRALERLTDLGVAVSLDDFGTGYSSLSHLRRLPLTKLKIDRSFIQELNTNAGSAQIVRAIVSLGHNLNLRVIAEGVESAEQLGFLREVGCDKYQGYFFSRPVPPEEFVRLVMANRASCGLRVVEAPTAVA
jgi:diguanylate cyclase